MSDDPDLDRAYALKTTDDNRQFYRDWASNYDAVFVEQTSYQLPELVAAAYVAGGGDWPCLDAGCGTGALGERLPDEAVIDGVDLSVEMLNVAHSKARYRHLLQANLKETLPFDDEAFAGLVSAGTFTHGHVGPEALSELVRVLRRGGLAVLSVKPEVWDACGFGAAFDELVQSGRISAPEISTVPVYVDPTCAPEGHGADLGLIVQFTVQ